jgi:ribonuclease PH
MSITMGGSKAASMHGIIDSNSYPHPNTPDGSAVILHGLTEVSAKVFGPREPQIRREAIHDRANINVQVVILSFSGGSTARRRGRGDKYDVYPSQPSL